MVKSKKRKKQTSSRRLRHVSSPVLNEKNFPHVVKAHQYAEDVINGKVVAGKYVRLALQRHFDDLEKARKADYPYYFDMAAGEEICAFSELFPHTKGALTGQLLRLEPWQCFINAVPFGWKVKETGYRRFTQSYEEIPRKNGKSMMAATRGLYMLTLDGEPGAEVYCGATTQKQANEVFQPARLMAKKSPAFLSAFDVVVGAESIFIRDSANRFERLIGDPGDGGSPHYAILDEKHQHKTDAQKETMVTGMGARRQPMLSEITTAGRNISYPCYRRRKYAEAVLEGRIVDDRFFCILYTIDEEDDWKVFPTWVKANPNVGVSLTLDYLRQRYEEAMNSPEKQGINQCKHLNQWMGASAGWLNMAKWSRAKTDLKLEDFEGEKCWVAFDFASKIDLASMGILFERDGKLYAFTKNYLPRETVNRPENEHYRSYEKMGLLTVTEGARTDFTYAEQDLKQLNEDFDIQVIAYDPKEATMFINSVLDWFGGDVVEIAQSAASLNEPMKEFEALVEAGELITEKNMLLDWCAGNVIKKQTANKYYFPAKEHNEDKIDPIVSLIMALKMYISQAEDEGPAILVATR